MRVSPVTGDLPAVAAAPVRPPAPAEAGRGVRPSVAGPAEVPGSGAHATSDPRRTPTLLPFFDPPLIAQRAVLGLPVGPLIAELALASGISWAAASAAVDREMPEPDR